MIKKEKRRMVKFGKDWFFGDWEDVEERMKKIDFKLLVEFRGLLSRYKGEKKYFMSGDYYGNWELELYGNLSDILYKLELYEYKKIGGSFMLWVDGEIYMIGYNYEDKDFYYKGKKYKWGFSNGEVVGEEEEEERNFLLFE